MKKMIYLDNAATTPTAPEVIEAMLPFYERRYGNPSALYDLGQKSHDAIEESRKIIAQSIGAQPEEIYFTAGGSESDNWALKCTAESMVMRGRHIITTKIEHHAILRTCGYLEQNGYEITYLPVNDKGTVSLEQVRRAIRPDTILISVMMANNEIGTIEPIARIGMLARRYGICFHTDAVQAYGHIPIEVNRMNIDMMSASAHKFNGPKGTGFLYVADGVKMHPIIHGGGQQNGRRSGTQNVPGIAGLGLAAKKMYEDHLAKVSQMYECKAHLIQKLEEIDKVTVHAVTPELRECAPHVVSASFEGVGSEVLLHALEDRGIYVSSGSACSSNHPGISSTLQAIGVPDKLLESTIRFSFSVYTTIEELDYTVEQLKELLPVLRRYVRR